MNAAYGIVTTIWVILALVIAIKIPKCASVGTGNKLIALVLLLLAAMSNVFLLYDQYAKKILVEFANKSPSSSTPPPPPSTSTPSASSTPGTAKAIVSMSNNSIMSVLFTILFAVVVAVLYYLALIAIFRCDRNVISPMLFGSFILVTIVHMVMTSIQRTKLDNAITWTMLYDTATSFY